MLATQAKEEQAAKRNDSSKLTIGPHNRIGGGGPKNADGTTRDENRIAVDARKSLRINALCHFLLLEEETLAGNITMSVIQVSCKLRYDYSMVLFRSFVHFRLVLSFSSAWKFPMPIHAGDVREYAIGFLKPSLGRRVTRLS